jgi:hypothetical protein
MVDAAPSFADRAAQLIADFQLAADDNAPVSTVMMAELRAVLDIGISAHGECAFLNAMIILVERMAA